MDFLANTSDPLIVPLLDWVDETYALGPGWFPGVYGCSGSGGASYWGGGVSNKAVNGSGAWAGDGGGTYGQGAGGAVSASGTNFTGGTGHDGVIIIKEYF